jgi:hypothetical protein
MDSRWLDDYISAWLLHPLAGSTQGAGALAQLLSFMSQTVRYEDVPSGTVFVGHQGIKEMSEAAHQWSSDLAFKVLTRQMNGSLYAFETETTGTNTGNTGPMPATRRPFVLRGVSVGTVSADGLVEAHRDYWDLGSFLAQMGVLSALS